VELDRQAKFNYPGTENHTSGMNMGQIIQIAMRIRNLTQQEIDEASSDDEPEEISMEAVRKRTELFEWMRFCKEKVDPIDKVWNRRLEDPPSEQSDSDEEPTIIEQEREEEKIIESIIQNVPSRRGLVGKNDAAQIRQHFADQEAKEKANDKGEDSHQ